MFWQHRAVLIFVSTVTVLHPAVSLSQRLGPGSRQSSQRAKRAAILLRRWDGNHDGYLQESEIPIAGRIQVEQLARRRGLDPTKPLRVDTLISTGDTATKTRSAPPQPQLTAEESRSKKTSMSRHGYPAADGETDDLTASASTAVSGDLKATSVQLPKTLKVESTVASKRQEINTRTLVRGFGVANNRPQVPGFGMTDSLRLASATTADIGGENDGNAASRQMSDDKRIQRLAKSLLVQKDKDKNGQLEKDEWSRLRGNPKKSDRNGDGILTLDELEQYLVSYGSRDDVKKRSSSKRRAKSTSRSPNSRQHKSYRFLTPHERLPDGLPDWFTARDVDGDGQLSMREYSGGTSRAKLKQFTAWDLNGDGIMTSDEYLAATKPAS